MFRFGFILFFSFLFTQNILMEIEERDVFDFEFFQSVPKSVWVEADKEKQSSLFGDFKNKEVVFHYSLDKGFDLFPDNFRSLAKLSIGSLKG